MTEIDENRWILEDLGVIDTQPSSEPDQQKSTDKRQNAETSSPSQTELIDYLKSIKARLDKLRTVFSTTLSPEISRQIDEWRYHFKEKADELLSESGGAELLYPIIAGAEDFYLFPPKPENKPTIRLEDQRWTELVWEVRQQPLPEPTKTYKPIDFGAGEFL
jgi:hypothetical protein